MARPALDFPSRVLAIAIVIAVLLAGFVWLLSGLGSPVEPPSAGVDDAVDGSLETGDPTVPAGAEDPGAIADPEAGVRETPGNTVVVQLYLAAAGSRELVPRVRRLNAPRHPAARAQMAVQALINAGEPGYVSPLPPTTLVREVWVDVDAGIAYVDFARGFRDLLGGGSLAELHAVYGVVGTLTGSFPEIERVQFLVDGRPVPTLTGHLDLSVPIGPSSDWLR